MSSLSTVDTTASPLRDKWWDGVACWDRPIACLNLHQTESTGDCNVRLQWIQSVVNRYLPIIHKFVCVVRHLGLPIFSSLFGIILYDKRTRTLTFFCSRFSRQYRITATFVLITKPEQGYRGRSITPLSGFGPVGSVNLIWFVIKPSSQRCGTTQ